ncbi:ABC transporter ATP-binding protein [Sulfolobus acidocaldarius]|uniref:ABC transporter ATP-binding protein n=1 Tax=Sulfolobus acidocaldarius TaxID=2285 RepID=UPI000784E8A1|nr:ABC transporter ATP-binding protein [Sulfolobus acidocaldarius]
MITLKHLVKRFGKKVVLDDVSLEVREGYTALVGPNGAGKSTLLGVLAGVYKYEGECHILGIECRDSKRIHERVSFSIDTPVFPDIKVRNILKIAEADEEIVYQLGAEEILKKNFNSLSTGQAKLVSISIALGRDADLYILDEPTANLDPDKRVRFYDVLLRKAKNVFIASHELSEVNNIASNLVIIRRGKIVFNGTLKELSNKYGNLVIIKTNRPQEIIKLLGRGNHFGNSVLIEGESALESILTELKSKDVNMEWVLGIDVADLSVFYRRMVEEDEKLDSKRD